METWEQFNADALAAIKARNLPSCTLNDPCVPVEIREKASVYLLAFLPPRGICVCCGLTLGGIFGTFEWGLRNGEGQCGHCGYPARAIHRIADRVAFPGLILQYHPDGLSFADHGAKAELDE